MSPVAIVPAQTGVTDGKAAQHSLTYVPRSRIAFSAGADPCPIARSSIVGFMPSMTVRTSLRGWLTASTQDAQAGVLLALAPLATAQEEREEAERDGGD